MGNKAATFSFLNKFSGQHIPLLAEEGSPRHQKKWIRSDLSRTGWSVRHPFKGQPNRPLLRLRAIALALRAVCAAFVASRHFLDGAATPPLRGGEYDAFKFRPNGNIIDPWLRRSRAKPFCGYFFFPGAAAGAAVPCRAMIWSEILS